MGNSIAEQLGNILDVVHKRDHPPRLTEVKLNIQVLLGPPQEDPLDPGMGDFRGGLSLDASVSTSFDSPEEWVDGLSGEMVKLPEKEEEEAGEDGDD